MSTQRFLLTLALLSTGLAQKQNISYHVALLIDGHKFCSGSLISENTVITTADCVYKAFEVDVVLGINNLIQPAPASFVCTTFIIHESYTSNSVENNIALIHIPTLTPNKYIIEHLWLNSTEVVDGTTPEISGFNLANRNSTAWSAQIGKVESGKCSAVTQNVFCVVPQTSRDSVNIGSAVTSSNVLEGIVVHIAEESTVVLKIMPFLPWIKANM